MKNKILSNSIYVLILMCFLTFFMAQISAPGIGGTMILNLGDICEAFAMPTGKAGVAFTIMSFIFMVAIAIFVALKMNIEKIKNEKFKNFIEKFKKYFWILIATTFVFVIIAFSCIMGQMNKFADGTIRAGAGAVFFFLFGIGVCGCAGAMEIDFKKLFAKKKIETEEEVLSEQNEIEVQSSIEDNNNQDIDE